MLKFPAVSSSLKTNLSLCGLTMWAGVCPIWFTITPVCRKCCYYINQLYLVKKRHLSVSNSKMN